jgi:hypothetical protein
MLGGGTLLSRSGGGAFRSLVVAGGRVDAPTDRVVELEVRSAQELRKVTTLQAKASVRRKIGACFAGSISHPCHEQAANSSRQAAGISQICSCWLRGEK